MTCVIVGQPLTFLARGRPTMVMRAILFATKHLFKHEDQDSIETKYKYLC